ncbi:hypothetical protein DITRI_Ditri17bG0088000 [Diplodiscus trichospermus]
MPFVKQATTSSISGFSISDEEFEHRNLVNLQEAEEIWKVSLDFGVVIDKDRNQVIEVFKNLEEEDRKRKEAEELAFGRETII